jgi:alpha-L-fucosidase
VRHAAAKRDFIAEFADGCRKEGLLVGLYYSLMDWHHPDWLALKRGDKAGHRRFLEYTHGQLRELCTRYGKIDLLFYDVPAPYVKPEEWQAREMNAMVRRLQPGILINDRNRLPGDFTTPEQHIQAAGKGRAWQTCMTMNETWAYSRGDDMWKSPKQLATYLQRIASAEGGFLLNIGPKPDGSVPAESVRILEALGGWMKRNGESIYGTTNAGIIMCACGGHTTVGNVAYIHAPQWCTPDIGVGTIESKVTRVTCLATGKPVKFKQTGTRLQLLELPVKPPDPVVTVFRIEVEGKLKIRPVSVFPDSITRI